MKMDLQNGIYYGHVNEMLTSFCILFLRASEAAKASEVGETLTKLWKMYNNLKKGIVKDLPVDTRHHPGNLSVLIGYGLPAFDLHGIQKMKPSDFSDECSFSKPGPLGGGAIVNGSGIMYGQDVRENHAGLDHVVIQFIGSTDLATHRAVVETWKELSDIKNANKGKEILRLTKFYTGFQRPDQRSWLDFHDGVSNMKSTERRYAIAINTSHLKRQDSWTSNGTYLIFLRIGVNLEIWRRMGRSIQELIIGRDKPTGCPIIGVDSKGNHVKEKGCPVGGTLEVVEDGNESYREHPDYGRQYLPHGVSDEKITKSHIGRVRHTDGIPTWQDNSNRIFRQGFEFLEPIDEIPFFRAGLNFVSFQKTPRRLFNILSLPQWLGNVNFGGDSSKTLPPDFLTVRAAGVFFVPPVSKEELPGNSMFFTNRSIGSSTFTIETGTGKRSYT
jgi:deferrochelatase/peroxidase EfeB